MLGGVLRSILGRLLPKLTKPAAAVLKNVLAPLGLSSEMSGIDRAIQKNKKKIHGTVTVVIFSDEGINDMVKIVKALEDSDVLMKGVCETLKNDIKKVVLYQFFQCC